MSLAVDELRSHLNSYVQSMTSGATPAEIIATFRKLHPDSISKASLELENMGLTRMVNSAGRRRPSQQAGQQDLFSSFGIPVTICVRDEEGHPMYLPVGKASILQARSWAQGSKKPRKITDSKVEMQRLIKQIEAFAESEETLVEDAMRASRENREKKEA